ncbi:MAG: NAD(P)-dependent alcohol dehydrogenase [Polyangiales bacterium]
MPTRAYAASNAKSPVAPFAIERRDVLPTDVAIDVQYCGVCHSDLHQVRNEWSNTLYPCVPGHEIVGRVARVGAQVKRFKVGDLAAVGCMVDACRECDACKRGLEQYCARGSVYTYNSADKHTGRHTFGGYSESVVVDEAFTLKLSAKLNPSAAAPLLCAGITTYSPLRHWKVGPGQKVGVVGLGGLGHMGVKFARAFGAHVVAFTTSPRKIEDALRLGAHEVVVSTEQNQLDKHRGSFDFILDTVSGEHDINALLGQLKIDGTLTLVGAPEKPLSVGAFGLLIGRHSLAGSGIGGIAETQEMLDFCAEHNVVSDVEVIAIQQIEEAYTRLLRGDVRYRFVIDMASIKQ